MSIYNSRITHLLEDSLPEQGTAEVIYVKEKNKAELQKRSAWQNGFITANI